MTNDTELYIKVEDGSIWIYDPEGNFMADIQIKFCPFCGENYQPDSSKREDFFESDEFKNAGEIKQTDWRLGRHLKKLLHSDKDAVLGTRQ